MNISPIVHNKNFYYDVNNIAGVALDVVFGCWELRNGGSPEPTLWHYPYKNCNDDYIYLKQSCTFIVDNFIDE